jgi:hypothetical protein
MGLVSVQAQDSSLPEGILAIDTILYRPDQQAIEVHISFSDQRFGQTLDESNLQLFEIMEAEEVRIHNFSRQKSSTPTTHIFHIHGYDFQASAHEALYRGEVRSLRAQLTGGSQIADKQFVIGSPTSPVNLGFVDWQLLALIGALIVAGLLALFSQFLPGLKRFRFAQKYIRRYEQIDKKQYARSDPYTLQVFDEEDKVVVKCRQIHHLDTWKLLDHKCVNYPGCLRHTPGVARTCQEGEGVTAGEVFFSQQGPYRLLNWVWFGALGGLFAWLCLVAVSHFSLHPVYELLGRISGDGNGHALLRDSLTGFSLGLFLSLMLAWAEEKGQSRRFSWGRILIRTLLGAIISTAIFFLSFLLFKELLGENMGFLRGLLTWALFGLFLGISLSIRSSIHILRGIVGGSLAGSLAFLLYYLPFLLNEFAWGRNSFEWTKMMGFIMLGAILAYTLVSVIRSYEDFELTYLSPAEFRRVNPISKWLKTGMKIFIGTDSSCYVFVKWSDLDPAVQPKHAELSYRDGKVFITPLHPIWLNGREIPLNKTYELRDKDEIQLGPEGVTRMLFTVKKEVNKAPTPSSRRTAAQASIKIQKRS